MRPACPYDKLILIDLLITDVDQFRTAQTELINKTVLLLQC